MNIFIAILALALAVPSADAAIIRSTKQKKLPTIANLRVADDLSGFGFDILKAHTTDAYDVWGSLKNERKKLAGEWFVRSMRFRSRRAIVSEAAFDASIADILRYSGEGSYEFTVFACPANIRKPNAGACATIQRTITFNTAKKAK